MHLLNIKRLAYERRAVNVLEDGKITSRTYNEVASAPASRPAAAVPPPPPAPRAVTASVVASLSPEISRLIDRLAAARATSNPAPAASSAPSASAPPANPSAPAHPPAAAAPRAVDFVSEEDVRQALAKGEKIYIRPRTIITPSARDLGNPTEVFVLSKD
jgi:acetaldehyde dehydrogenase (acetylating)